MAAMNLHLNFQFGNGTSQIDGKGKKERKKKLARGGEYKFVLSLDLK